MNSIFVGYNNKIITDKHKKIMSYLNITTHENSDNKIILDIETDGKNTLVQVSYCIIDNDNNIIVIKDFFIHNKLGITDFYNKISYFQIQKFGIDLEKFLNVLSNDLKICDTIIGHNIAFDIRKLTQISKKTKCMLNFDDLNIVCTMRMSRDLVKVRDKKNRIKNPKLCELCNFLEIESDDEFHDACFDVQMTFRCYVELQKIEKIKY